jgi:lactoylglutathione lyase
MKMSALTKGVHHAGLSVKDVAASKDFYTELFGWEVVGENPGVSAFLTDGTTMITLWQQAENEADIKTAGLHHLAFGVESLETLQVIEERLRERDVEIQFDGLGEYGRLAGLFFFDPNGIRVEVTWEHGGAAGGLPTIGGCGHHHG